MPINKKTALGLKYIISSNLAITPSVVSPPIPLFFIFGMFNLSLQSLPPAVILLPKKTMSFKFRGFSLNSSITFL